MFVGVLLMYAGVCWALLEFAGVCRCLSVFVGISRCLSVFVCVYLAFVVSLLKFVQCFLDFIGVFRICCVLFLPNFAVFRFLLILLSFSQTKTKFYNDILS